MRKNQNSVNNESKTTGSAPKEETATLPHVDLDRKTLIEILAVVGDDFPRGFDILENFIRSECYGYASKCLKEFRHEFK